MSTAVMPESRSVTALSKVETLRLARHPTFLIGAVITGLACLVVAVLVGPDIATVSTPSGVRPL